MSEIRTGWRSVLARPEVYRWARDLLGLNRWLDDYVTRYVKPQPGEKILDIGCGTGEIVRYLAGCEYLGIDRHQPYINYAQRTFGSAGRFICADVADHIDAFDSRFDVILANGLLHHLDDDLAHRLFELGHRALAENDRMEIGQTFSSVQGKGIGLVAAPMRCICDCQSLGTLRDASCGRGSMRIAASVP